MKTEIDILNLLALLKNSILEELRFQDNYLRAKWELFFNNPAGEFIKTYTLFLRTNSSFTLYTKTKTYSEAELQTYPDLKLLVLVHDLTITEPEHITLMCRILDSSTFGFKEAKLNLPIIDFKIRNTEGTAISLSHLIALLSSHNQQLLQKEAQSYLKNQYNSFLKNGLQVLLRSKGFKGKNSFFYFNYSHTVCVIEVVKSRWNSALGYSFILRMHLFGGHYAPAVKIRKLEELFTPASVLLFSKNIGPLENTNEGLGYPLNGRIPLQLLWDIVAIDLEREVFPFIEELQTKESLLTYLTRINQQAPNQPYTLNLAILQALWGNKEAALKLFEAAKTDNEKMQALLTYYNMI